MDSYVTRDGGELGEWSWPRVRHRLSATGPWFYSIGSCGNPYNTANGAILLIKGGKKPKPKIGLKKCPGVWHDLKSQLGYYDIRKHANPEQVCLAKCREDSNCKAAQVQFGKLPKVKVKSAGTPLVRGKSVFYKFVVVVSTNILQTNPMVTLINPYKPYHLIHIDPYNP